VHVKGVPDTLPDQTKRQSASWDSVTPIPLPADWSNARVQLDYDDGFDKKQMDVILSRGIYVGNRPLFAAKVDLTSNTLLLSTRFASSPVSILASASGTANTAGGSATRALGGASAASFLANYSVADTIGQLSLADTVQASGALALMNANRPGGKDKPSGISASPYLLFDFDQSK
jgi:hypothetical protein